jgi:hypothetical protein
MFLMFVFGPKFGLITAILPPHCFSQQVAAGFASLVFRSDFGVSFQQSSRAISNAVFGSPAHAPRCQF